MIQLEQIPASDKLGNLRNRINTMANEINTNQMVVGRVLNPSINFYGQDGTTLVGALTASRLNDETRLFALCMPESNGLFIASVFGHMPSYRLDCTAKPLVMEVDFASIKLPTKEAAVSTYVGPRHLGLILDSEEDELPGECVNVKNIENYVCGYVEDATDKTVNFGKPILRVESNHAAIYLSPVNQ